MNGVLELQGVSKAFAGLMALQAVSLTIREGDIFGLIGPNGSGKTTLLNVITGFLKPNSGAIIYRGQRIDKLPPARVSRLGLVRTFQITSTFADLTAVDNVIAGLYQSSRARVLDSLLRNDRYRDDEARLRKRAEELLAFLEIGTESKAPVKDLPAIEQRKLEIAIALAAGPRLLLLDEPSAGMSPEEQNRLTRHIRALPQQGITVCIVEHNMRVIMGLTDRIAVLDSGEKIAEGSPEEIVRNDLVVSIYLGKKRL
jgi:branched-chain amino acid transport system ATP-binding protein